MCKYDYYADVKYYQHMPENIQDSCPFCAASENPDQHIIYENSCCFYLRKPQAKLTGAGLIVPRSHKQTVFDLSTEEWADTLDLLHRAKSYLDDQFNPDGYTVGWNSGEAAGQDIPHAHLHVIPRFNASPSSGISIRDGLLRRLDVTDGLI